MSKLSVIHRDLKRRKTVEKYKELRTSLKKKMVDKSLSIEEKDQARLKLQSLPRNASPTRLRSFFYFCKYLLKV